MLATRTICFFISLWFFGSIAHSEEDIKDVVLLASICPASVGETRAVWPLPKDCECPTKSSDWACWLTGREASTAQDLGEVDTEKKLHHWRLNLSSKQCSRAVEAGAFLEYTDKYVPIKATSKSIEIQKDGKVLLKGILSGKTPLFVVPTAEAITEALRLEEEAASSLAVSVVPVKADAGVLDAGVKILDVGAKVIIK